MEHSVTFTLDAKPVTVSVPTNTLLADAAHLAGIEIGQPCGGQGRCGRCAVQVTAGIIRRRSTLRLSPADVEQGYALACQSVVEGDVSIYVQSYAIPSAIYSFGWSLESARETATRGATSRVSMAPLHLRCGAPSIGARSVRGDVGRVGDLRSGRG